MNLYQPNSDDCVEKEVIVRLAPPFKKAGESGELCLKLPREIITLRQMAGFLFRERLDCLAFAPIDRQGFLTATFIVNGEYASPEQVIAGGDEIIFFRRIGGG